MSSKHARLVAAVADAMAAQGFTQKQVATMAGCTQSMLSQALNNGVTLKDERWKLICEGLGLDYDEIVADVPAERERFTLEEPASSVSPQADCHLPQVGEGKERAAPVEETRGGTDVLCDAEERPAIGKQDMENLFLLAMYAEGRLAQDIESGMKVDPMKLWGILDALKKIKDRTLMPE